MAELSREDFNAALAEIYTCLLDYAARQLPDPSLAQDAVHDAIVFAYQNWNSDRCDVPAIQGWIVNILQNRIRYLTRQYFQESKEIIHLHELPLCPWISSEDQLIQKERLQKLNAASRLWITDMPGFCISTTFEVCPFVRSPPSWTPTSTLSSPGIRRGRPSSFVG